MEVSLSTFELLCILLNLLSSLSSPDDVCPWIETLLLFNSFKGWLINIQKIQKILILPTDASYRLL